ncbi:hypothetical protein PMAYCL1PPCAC_06942 [Pristionchus mayeri]|uniref:Uncharacterized protein n=1 Tax=Pristionchus mayeri TaxID=1317129 RepID=A0AAN4ZFB0_9BILA|nr:hypothetical protein PMAYCL1PPCAC_06942 [Pristionchus mayeri]
MRLVTHLYSSLLFLLLSIQELTASEGRIHCGNAIFCFPNKKSNEFEYYEKMSKEMEVIMKGSAGENTTGIPMVEGSTLFRKLTEMRKFLCSDMSITGFLLDENAKNWTTQCVWNGRDYNGICMPAPTKADAIFYYIEKNEWKKRLQIYREKIGCSVKEIAKVDSAEEQFVCRERCMQGGISYAASMIMIASFCISFMINCV